jgi:hypothetical protein
MDFHSLIVPGLVLLIGLVVFGLSAHRTRAVRRRRSRNRLYYPKHSALGNAFLELQKIARPSVEHALQGKHAERADEDDESGSQDPTEHLHRQLRRIQNGEKVENLKVFRKPPD